MKYGAVATSNKIAGQVALDILKAGGNAFDATVATLATLGVVEPGNSGLGGGGLWILAPSDGPMVMVDSREQAPSHIDYQLYQRKPYKRGSGCASTAIPGLPAALHYVNKHYGSRTLEKNLEPAIYWAENGFPVDSEYRRLLSIRYDKLKNYKTFSRQFLLEDGQIPPEGHLIVQPELAQTLRRLAQQGRTGFYTGPVAQKMVQFIRNHGGTWTLKDLRNYKVKISRPLQFNFKDATLYAPSLPSSGGYQLQMMLQILEHLEKTYSRRTENYADQIHLLLEAIYKSYYYRHCFSLSRDHPQIDQLSQHINLEKTDRSVTVCPHTSEQTSHLSIIDRWGNAVSVTVSTNHQYGSGIIPPKTGVLLNNQMKDFSLDPKSANFLRPKKRPLSCMTPIIMDYGGKRYVLGTPGGIRIASTVFLAVIFLINHPEKASLVTQLPRFHYQYRPNEQVEIEQDSFPEELIHDLESRGHKVVDLGRTWGNLQLIIFSPDLREVEAITDPRYLGWAKSI